MKAEQQLHSYGIKDVDEHPFLSEGCGSGTISASVGDSWQSRQQSFSDYQNDYSYLQLQNTPTRQKQDQGRCYDLKTEEKDEEAHKVMHHFFDESPHNNNDDHNKDKDSSTTQLSISIPNCGHDFFLIRNDK
ncbi:hypothetical protein L1987_29320 [Smallanthus sonchifolius]|uniref:Uncharacterized protein n=1 Tax=Smallanthus sonchifolius TaxID=185202 RepID=A0ACB9I0F7_9ASTR|nr:hypothetical protein L1987_29320 [Smallanthus sonchifolius]